MSFLKQKTIKKIIQLEGVGLHSGKTAILTINPALPNTGIVFIRSDLDKNNVIYFKMKFYFIRNSLPI